MRLSVPVLPRWARWATVAGVASVIFYTSIVTVPPETVLDRTNPGGLDSFQLRLDKWRHFLAYAAFGYALAYATADWRLTIRRRAAFVLGVAVLYGVGIECGQSLVPERYFSVGDAYANALGALLVAPWYLIRPSLVFVPLRTWLSAIAERRRG